jgi:dimethylamine/trimethylamine dehydrogenase
MGQIGKLASVEVFLESEVTVALAAEIEADHIAVATGAHWRRDGVGKATPFPVALGAGIEIVTPDDVFAGARPPGPVVIYDDDHGTLGGALAEKLASEGAKVTIVTPASDVSAFTEFTLDRHRIIARLDGSGVGMVTHHVLEAAGKGRVALSQRDTGRALEIEAGSLLLVTARLPGIALFRALQAAREQGMLAHTKSISRIGDCDAPAAIVHAVYAGHRYARELGEARTDVVFARERVALS